MSQQKSRIKKQKAAEKKVEDLMKKLLSERLDEQ